MSKYYKLTATDKYPFHFTPKVFGSEEEAEKKVEELMQNIAARTATTKNLFFKVEPAQIIGYDCVISYYNNDGSLDEELDVYMSISGDMDIDTECDSFGVSDTDIFFYLGSDVEPKGDSGDFWVHSATPVFL